jgi:hypothetical protein
METRASQICGWAWRSPVVRAMSVLAVAGALLGSMPNPAAADGSLIAKEFANLIPATIALQPSDTLGVPSTPLRLDFFKLICTEEADDGFFDLHSEPYLVVFAADISGPVPRSIGLRSSIFGSVDSGETHIQNPVLQMWDVDGTGSPIPDPNKVIFLCALMESDDSSARADTVRTQVGFVLFHQLRSYMNGGLSRASIISNLTADMNRVINANRGGDDRIGGVQELRLTLTDVERARRGTEPQVIKTLRHVAGDADYTTVFVLQTTLFVIN